MKRPCVGWDVGGAHLKAARLNGQGDIDFVHQEACPLWKGLDQLDHALDRMLALMPKDPDMIHAVTMTGELADLFANRPAGVLALTGAMSRRLGHGRVRIFRGGEGFIAAEDLTVADAAGVASANWLATGIWLAARLGECLMLDIGSTTSDILPIVDGRPAHRGYTDCERMRYDELVYTGVTRTPVMLLAKSVPLNGVWSPVMAEHFASTADVYRLTGHLSEACDQMPAADQGPKTPAGSRQRLARQFGYDSGRLADTAWDGLAHHLRERQLSRLGKAVDLQLSRGLLGPRAPLVGAGIGRFLVEMLAKRLERDYLDVGRLFTPSPARAGFALADCAPAAALACIAHGGQRPTS